MAEASRQAAEETLAEYIEQGRTLVERARLIGDDSDYDSWKADRNHWIGTTLQALARVYPGTEAADHFRSAASPPSGGQPWHLEFRRDVDCAQTAIELLSSLQQGRLGPADWPTTELEPPRWPEDEHDAAPEVDAEYVDHPEPAQEMPRGASFTEEPLASLEFAPEPPEDSDVTTTLPVPNAPQARPESSQVFLVHGRNESWRQEVAGLLERAGTYDVTVLNERPADRKALVEHSEDHVAQWRFAIVLLTADDVGAARRGDSDREPYFSPRARQAVVFEMGVLVAVLTPRGICVLYEEGVELPCDLDGVTYVHLDSGGAWKSKLLLQLRGAGFDYDLNRLATL